MKAGSMSYRPQASQARAPRFRALHLQQRELEHRENIFLKCRILRALSPVGEGQWRFQMVSHASTAVKVTSRAQAMALKPGTVFITPDGRRLVR